MNDRMTRLLAAVLLPLFVLVLVAANTPRFVWRETDDVEDLLEIPAFSAAAERYEAQHKKLVWYDPHRYTRPFPYMGEVLCVPYLACDVTNVETAGSWPWQFTIGMLLWDPVSQSETNAPELMCKDIVIRLQLEDSNTEITAYGANTRMDRSEWPDLPMIAALRYRHDETGVRSAPAVGPITLEAYASVEDSDVDPNAEHRVHIIASYALYCKGLLPTEEQQLTIGTSGIYISNVRNVS